jgi:hypothetical protein
MAQQPKKRKRKVKRKVRITQKARIQKKDSVSNDTLKRDTLRNAPTKTVLPTNGITFKVKLRKK